MTAPQPRRPRPTRASREASRLPRTSVESLAALGQAGTFAATLAERKLLHLRHDDACAHCSLELPAGTLAYWDRQERRVFCRGCGDDPTPSATASEPGGSALREHERR